MNKDLSAANKVIQIENLTVRYGDAPVITDICLDVYEGDYLGIIGPNGGGKTTLLKSIIGLVKPVHGKISIFGKNPDKTRGLVGYVPQITALEKKFPIRVREVVLTGRLNGSFRIFHKYSDDDLKVADDLIERVGIGKLSNRMIGELSGGEFQKMLIARALAADPRILLLDEPTASVDAGSRDQIFALLKEINKKVTIILVTHDLLAISSYVRTLACLNETLVYHGGTELSEEAVKTLYGCPIDLIAHGVPHRVLRKHKEEQRL